MIARQALLTSASVLLAFCVNAAGPEASKVQEPEFLGNFCLRDPATGALSKLERQVPENRLHYAGAMGIGKAQGYMKIDGPRSSVRFKEGQPLEFVVLVPSQQTDPQEIVSWFALESLKDTRRLLQSKASSVLGVTGANSVVSESQIPFDAAKYGSSSFKITASQPLLPGEYVLMGTNHNVAYCFGIDADLAYEASRKDLNFDLPFRTGEALPLGLAERLVTIKSVEISSWPKPEEVQRAQGRSDAMSSLTLKFTYANLGKRAWKCKFHVAILDDKGAQLGMGERDAKLGEGEKSDTERVSVTIWTRDFPRASALRVRVQPRLD